MTDGIRSPEEFLGFRPGQDRKLARWDEITGYFREISRSPRLLWERFGRSTEGRDLYLATISSQENIENLEQLRGLQKKLIDPRSLSAEELADTMARARSVMLLTCSIHATEVGSTQMSMELAFLLVTQERFRRLLDQVILLIVPCLNPDGLDLVADWYYEQLDSPYEGTSPPQLYHRYAGHDNNRDWFMLTQAENRALVSQVHNRWHPHIVFDQHQMGTDGARFILPPFVDPVDPAVDPVLWAAGGALGHHIAHALTTQGLKGVAVNAIFDAYSPSRAYQHYHGGVRILSEAASARLATPVQVPADSLKSWRGYDPRQRAWNHPHPWEGGRWALEDIVTYQKAAAVACLEHAAYNRRLWVEGFVKTMRRAQEGPDQVAGYLIPACQESPAPVEELVEVLVQGLVEVYCLEKTVVDGVTYPAGSYWIPLTQSFESYARTLLESAQYPDFRQYPGGPPKVPYDTTTKNLPLLMGIELTEIRGAEEGATDRERARWTGRKPMDLSAVRYRKSHEISDQEGWLLSPGQNRSHQMVNQVLTRGGKVFRVSSPGHARHGWFYVPGPIGGELPPGLRYLAVGKNPELPLEELEAPRIGIYRSHVPSADEGWTRWILREYGFSYSCLDDAAIKEGLHSRPHILLLPDMEPSQIREGHRPGSYPSSFVGGLNDLGARSLERYLQDGGVVLALGRASSYLVKELLLGAEDLVSGRDPQDFYAPGTMVNLLFNTIHPMALGLPRRGHGLLTGGPVFRSDGARTVASFPRHRVRADGFLLGEEHLEGEQAILDIPLGRGSCLLSPVRLQFRAQARGTYPLLFNAIHYARLRSEGGNNHA